MAGTVEGQRGSRHAIALSARLASVDRPRLLSARRHILLVHLPLRSQRRLGRSVDGRQCHRPFVLGLPRLETAMGATQRGKIVGPKTSRCPLGPYHPPQSLCRDVLGRAPSCLDDVDNHRRPQASLALNTMALLLPSCILTVLTRPIRKHTVGISGRVVHHVVFAGYRALAPRPSHAHEARVDGGNGGRGHRQLLFHPGSLYLACRPRTSLPPSTSLGLCLDVDGSRSQRPGPSIFTDTSSVRRLPILRRTSRGSFSSKLVTSWASRYLTQLRAETMACLFLASPSLFSQCMQYSDVGSDVMTGAEVPSGSRSFASGSFVLCPPPSNVLSPDCGKHRHRGTRRTTS